MTEDAVIATPESLQSCYIIRNSRAVFNNGTAQFQHDLLGGLEVHYIPILLWFSSISVFPNRPIVEEEHIHIGQLIKGLCLN